MKPNIIAYVCTRDRYFTTLPMTLNAIINQTLLPKKIIIYDDNNPDVRIDLRENHVYNKLFMVMDLKGIEWEVVYGFNKGQHYGHQHFNERFSGEILYRCDDDAIPEPCVLETLYSYMTSDVGAVAGSILTPPFHQPDIEPTGIIDNIDVEPNIQWSYIKSVKEVDHLHCSFLYRAGVYDYNLGLSRVAHREETLFTYGLKKKGYKLLVVPNAVTWHFKNPNGGIRSETQVELYEHDQTIFENLLKLADKTIVVLDCGMGDHIVFKHVLPDVQNPVVFSCYPSIIPGRSIQEAIDIFGSIDQYSIYKKMDEWRWKTSLEQAFRKMYCKL